MFIVVLQDNTMFTIFILVCSLKSMCIPSFGLTGRCISELHAHLCPHRSVGPEVSLQELYIHIVYRIVYM